MCRLLLGFSEEQTFTVPHESMPPLEAFVRLLSERKDWPSEPVVLDLWGEAPPLVINGSRLSYLTVERCQLYRDRLKEEQQLEDDKKKTPDKHSPDQRPPNWSSSEGITLRGLPG